ncbi:helix-turn-helix domain-containing protein [Patescibacteria group bacterium]
MEKFLTVKEVANRLKVSERTIFRYVKKGELKASKIGHWRINEDDLTKFIKSKTNI